MLSTVASNTLNDLKPKAIQVVEHALDVGNLVLSTREGLGGGLGDSGGAITTLR